MELVLAERVCPVGGVGFDVVVVCSVVVGVFSCSGVIIARGM